MPLKINKSLKPSRNEISCKTHTIHIDTIAFIAKHFYQQTTSFDQFFDKIRRYRFLQSEIFTSCEKLLSEVLICKCCNTQSSNCMNSSPNTNSHAINFIFKLFQRSKIKNNVAIFPHPDDSAIVIGETSNATAVQRLKMPKFKSSTD